MFAEILPTNGSPPSARPRSSGCTVWGLGRSDGSGTPSPPGACRSPMVRATPLKVPATCPPLGRSERWVRISTRKEDLP
jgi:hypothetical protein